MTKTSTAQRLIAAAVLTTAVMLLGALPVTAAPADVLEGWIHGPEAAPRTDTYSDDGWAHGQGMRSEQRLPVDGWAIGQGLRAEQRSPVDGWAIGQGIRTPQRSTIDGWAVGQGMRSQTTSPVDSPSAPSTPDPVSVPFIVGGLLIAALLGGVTATAVAHRRHAPATH